MLTFYAGAAFTGLALLGLWLRPGQASKLHL